MPKDIQIIEDLGNGLVVRRTNVEDTEALVKFNGEVHVDPDEDFAERVAGWVRDLMTKPHPTFRPEDFTIVEDTNTGHIVSCLNLIDQTWAYEGIEFGVGRVELVGTHPEYRRRGLIRKQVEVVHKWSAERGHKVQAITGIPWYYRQFGYEMGLNLGGGRRGYPVHIPKLKEDEKEPYKMRLAEEKDIPFISNLYAMSTKRSMVSSVRDEAIWKYELTSRGEDSGYKNVIQIIETPRGKAIGFLAHPIELWGTGMVLFAYEISDGVSWLAVTPTVIRYLKATGEEYAKKKEDKEFQNFYINLGAEHPAYEVVPDRLPRINTPYAWYVRVTDIPDFLLHISPVLEERIANSYIVGHTGELWLSFFTEGVKMVFEKGKVKSIETWEKPETEEAMAFFPDLTFLQLLFGYRSFDELKDHYADCYFRGDKLDTPVILRVLFPKKASDVWGLG